MNDDDVALLDKIIKFVNDNTSEDTNIYIGSDSKNIRSKRFTQFIVAIVVHYNGDRGSKLFGTQSRVPMIRSVNQRLMMEAYNALEVALYMRDKVGKRSLSVHLDINGSPEHKSNQVTTQATNLISGQGFKFKIKPYAIAATSAADYLSNNPGVLKKINKF